MVTRRESVIIEARSNLSTVALKDAAAVSLLRKEIGDLDGTNIKTSRSTDTVTESVNRQGDAFRKQTASIDQFSGRLRLMTEAAVIGGPALISMGAVAVPAIAGLASSLGFAAVGAGTLAAGFSGVFDTLELLNKAQLDPTKENLKALREGMEQLSPAAQGMVREIDKLGPVLKGLRDASAEGMAPEIERGVANLIEGLPRLRGLFEETANATAGVLADGAGILTSDRWQPFLRFLEREAPAAIESLGGTTGDLAHGFAELWRAMDPLNDDVLGVFERGAAGFDKWASGLSKTEGFQEFVSYVRENGPLVGDALASMANAVLQIAEAAAPLGGPVLRAISEISDGIATIADSPLGTPFAVALTGVLALNRALKISAALSAGLAGAGLLGGGKGKGGAASGLLGGAALGAAAGGSSKGSALRDIGRDATFAATGLFALDQGINILDSFSRTMDTSSVSASDGMRQIRDSLEESNVGKYAEDMGIDLDRLARDIYRFGDSGDYYKEAVDTMKSADDGFKGLGSNVLGFLTPMISDTEKAGLAMLDLDRIAGGSNGLSSFGGDVDEVSNDMKRLARELFHLNGIKIKPDLDTGPFGTALQGITRDLNNFDRREARAKADIEDSPFRSAIKGITRDINNFDGKKARARAELNDSPFSGAIKGVSRLLGDFDGKKGTARASLDDNPFAQNYNRVRRSVDTLNRAKPTPTANLNDAPFSGRQRGVMNALGVTDRFTATPTANLIDNASGKAAGITNQLNNIPRSISTTVTTYFRQIGRAFQQKADGGLITGPGGPRDDAIPTMLSNGEYVVNAASTARNRPLLEQINAQKFADGGMVREQPWRQQSHRLPASSAASRQAMAVSFDDVRLTGSVDTRTGIATMTGIARAVADERIDAERKHQEARAGA